LEELTKEPIKGNYMKYMPSAASRSAVSGWQVDKEPTSFEMIQEEFPILSTTDSGRTQPVKAAASSKLKLSGGNSDKKGKRPFSVQLPFRPAIKPDETLATDIKDKAQYTVELPLRLLSDSSRNTKDGPPNSNQPLRPAFKSGVTTVIAGMDPCDPNNPAFSAASCYCEITEKFNCPKRLCG
jgi:general transcription factor 3C polypeptide 5 (transcription factor C subunit 1)